MRPASPPGTQSGTAPAPPPHALSAFSTDASAETQSPIWQSFYFMICMILQIHAFQQGPPLHLSFLIDKREKLSPPPAKATSWVASDQAATVEQHGSSETAREMGTPTGEAGGVHLTVLSSESLTKLISLWARTHTSKSQKN